MTTLNFHPISHAVLNNDEKNQTNRQHLGIESTYTMIPYHRNAIVTDNSIETQFIHEYNHVKKDHDAKTLLVTPRVSKYLFRTERKPNKTGCMVVGLAGNNGSTLVGGILANKLKLSWNTKKGVKHPDYYGSLTQSTTIRIGVDDQGDAVHVPMKCVAPFVNIEDVVFSGWDICSNNLAQSMKEAEVFDYNLQEQLVPHLERIVPLKGIFKNTFISDTMSERINHTLSLKWTNQQYLDQIRLDIRNFKQEHGLESVIILNQASTERYVEEQSFHNCADDMLTAVTNNHSEISPSQLYAMASILEGCTYINGCPQNTLVKGIIELASRHNVFCMGNDLKSGNTSIKSVIADYFTSRGLKMHFWTSNNFLGNNDSLNLVGKSQFRSKEISKSGVIEDMINSNTILYPRENGKPHKIDHLVTIDRVPYTKDDKRALDEIVCSAWMGAENKMVLYHLCPDSSLAGGILIDAIVLSEYFSRVSYKTSDQETYRSLPSVLGFMAPFWKAPQFPEYQPVTNSLFKQIRSLTNFILSTLGLAMDTDMYEI